MNILYIHTTEERDAEIFKAFENTDATLFEYESPAPGEKDETYVTGLLKAMEENSIDICFSLMYFPIVSVANQAMKKTYIAYCQRPYNPSLYSCTLVNECNVVFVPDYTVYEKFVGEGFNNVFFMPIGVDASVIPEKVTEEDSEGDDGIDLTITEEIGSRADVEINLLSSASPLKDATKGYLEGCIACRHQIRGLPSMYQYLPPYIKEEILKMTPPVLVGDSVETPATYFDNRSFNHLVTIADRDIHFSTLIKNDHFEKVRVYADGYENDLEKVETFGTLARGAEFNEAVRRSKINLIIPHRNWQSGVSGRTWDTLAAGGYVMEPFMADLTGLFETPLEYLFTDEFSMVSKSINRLHHPEERVETVNSLLQEIRDKHTYMHRIATIFDVL